MQKLPNGLKVESRAPLQTLRSIPSSTGHCVITLEWSCQRLKKMIPDFLIPRNLYYGIMLAAEEFNNRNADRKVRLIFKNSAENPDTTACSHHRAGLVTSG
jgi:hypothetical protein